MFKLTDLLVTWRVLFRGYLEIPKFILDETNFFMKSIKFPVEWSGSRHNWIHVYARTTGGQIAHAGAGLGPNPKIMTILIFQAPALSKHGFEVADRCARRNVEIYLHAS